MEWRPVTTDAIMPRVICNAAASIGDIISFYMLVIESRHLNASTATRREKQYVIAARRPGVIKDHCIPHEAVTDPFHRAVLVHKGCPQSPGKWVSMGTYCKTQRLSRGLFLDQKEDHSDIRETLTSLSGCLFLLYGLRLDW